MSLSRFKYTGKLPREPLPDRARRVRRENALIASLRVENCAAADLDIPQTGDVDELDEEAKPVADDDEEYVDRPEI